VASNGQSRRKSKQPDFRQGRRERRPVQTYEEAARGGTWKQHGISQAQVMRRVAPIEAGAPELWPLIQQIVADCIAAGYLIASEP
jgi:hypothetical protein